MSHSGYRICRRLWTARSPQHEFLIKTPPCTCSARQTPSPLTIMAGYAQPPPRFSVLSSPSLSSLEHLSPTASSARFSLPSAPSISTAIGIPKPVSRPNIYDRPLNKARTAEVSLSAYAFLFSEVVQYTQKRVSGINDLERR